ncbi:MAG: glutamate--tRNA ligase [Longimicrobiales bacterium]
MNDTSHRVRFAPSPTGYLHVGGARTALFNWLLARKSGGVFVLRIEDTDRARSDEPMTQVILDGLGWLGLDWDEGPYFQAEGIDRHRADARRIFEAGAAYRCFCTQAQLEARRVAAAGGEGAFRYDRHCLRTIDAMEAEQRAREGEPHTLRFHVPAGTTSWDDAVHGTIAFENDEIEDFIILRNDGTPIYNLAVVSDDIAMGITLVMRGDDHISNTPKQILLYRVLGAAVPRFAHVPLILGEDGKRLSKRHGATAVGEYRNRGILPAAMVNFLALLGWAPGTDEEVFTVDELIDRFTLERLNKKSAVFDVRKLQWLNGQHLTRMDAAALAPLVLERLETRDASPAELDSSSARLYSLIDLLKVRARSIDDMVTQMLSYFSDTVEYSPDAIDKHWKDGAVAGERLAQLRVDWAALEQWDEVALEASLRSRAEQIGVGAGRLIHPLRVALTGQAVSPGIFEVVHILGRDRTLHRLDAAIERLFATRHET